MTQTPPSPGTARSPWIFILKEGLLPGQFYLSLFRPLMQELPRVIVEDICARFNCLLAVYEKWADAGLIRRRINGLAMMLADEYTSFFTRASGEDQPVWVIPQEEFQDRADRGEFAVRKTTRHEKLKEGRSFHKVLVNYYRNHARSGGRFSWRLQSESSKRLKRLPTVYAWIDPYTNEFFYKWDGPRETETLCATHRLFRQKVEYSAKPKKAAAA